MEPRYQGGPGLPGEPPSETKDHFPPVLNLPAYYECSVPVTAGLYPSAGRFTVPYGPDLLQGGEVYFLRQVQGRRDGDEVSEMPEEGFQEGILIGLKVVDSER